MHLCEQSTVGLDTCNYTSAADLEEAVCGLFGLSSTNETGQVVSDKKAAGGFAVRLFGVCSLELRSTLPSARDKFQRQEALSES